MEKRGPKGKINAETEKLIREMLDRGLSDEEIGRAIGVHRTTILRLRHFIETEEYAQSAQPEKGTLEYMIWVSARLGELYDKFADADDVDRVKIEKKIAALKPKPAKERCYCLKPGCELCWGD